MQEAATFPENFVTVFHTMVTDLNLETPWPKPDDYKPAHTDTPILIWGAASSVGQYALQILKFYGYKRLIATASPQHHDHLKQLGATDCFNYRDADVVQKLLSHVKVQAADERGFPLIIDCIGSKAGSLAPISRIAQRGSTVAAMLPVILIHATEDQTPEYSMDVASSAAWAEGVATRGVRTHYYAEVNISQSPCKSTNVFEGHMLTNSAPEQILQGALAA